MIQPCIVVKLSTKHNFIKRKACRQGENKLEIYNHQNHIFTSALIPIVICVVY